MSGLLVKPGGPGPGRPVTPPGLSGGPGGYQGGDVERGDTGNGRKSWAEMLGSSLTLCLNKNVLEIVLDKDQRGAFIVSDHDCARVMRKIGLDQRPGVHVEAVQICPNGRGVILITLKPDVAVANFCRHDVLEVTASGIRAVHIKPAGKRDAVVTIKGLHPNTRDDGVLIYLNKFAKSVTNRVIHGVYAEGPLKGLKNGDRSYKLEIKPNENIGTYHVLDGQKVTLRYPGQQQTCARCHEVAKNCKGGAMARRCETAGGVKVDLSDYIINLWNKIGYVPGDVELAAVYDDHDDHDPVKEQAGGNFTPEKKVPLPDSFAGVSIRQIPKDTDAGQIMEFLVMSGLPETKKENVVIRTNGSVIINNLENQLCQVLIKSIHSKKEFGKKLYCDGIVPFTPEKPDNAAAASTCSVTTPPATTVTTSTASPAATATASSVGTAPAPPTAPVTATTTPQLNNSNTPAQVTTVYSLTTPAMVPGHTDVTKMVDEYQTRLLNEDLDPVEKSNLLLPNLKVMNEQLSEFGSAREELSTSSSETSEDEDSFSPVFGRKPKRQRSKTPPSQTQEYI